MSWLRIDDGFIANAKVAQLTDPEFRVWMRVLCYCAKSLDPTVDQVTKREVSGLSLQRIRRFADLELLDAIGGDYEVHNWTKYLPKEAQNAARQAKYRARKRNGQSNAPRNATGDDDVTAGPSHAGAGTRGRSPVPVPVTKPSVVTEEAEESADPQATTPDFEIPDNLTRTMP
jgi:hypothetical protein